MEQRAGSPLYICFLEVLLPGIVLDRGVRVTGPCPTPGSGVPQELHTQASRAVMDSCESSRIMANLSLPSIIDWPPQSDLILCVCGAKPQSFAWFRRAEQAMKKSGRGPIA